MKTVARGHIRVDARRAVEKLREHLLVDLDLFLLEIVRAAVAGGASRIELACDADDLWVRWDGGAFEGDDLEHLLDHLLSEGAGDRRLRLLALGVNAALGRRPKHVDLYGRAGDRFERLRYTPQALAAERGPERRAVPAAEDERWASGMLMTRARLDWEVVGRAFGGKAPRPVHLLAERCRSVGVRLTLAGRALARRSAPVLARVALDLPGTRRAWLELGGQGSPAIEYCELGVRLAVHAWSPEPAFESASDLSLPMRVVVDADELPTNAARSVVLEDAPLLESAPAAAGAAFPALVAWLSAIVTGAPAPRDLTVERLVADDAPFALALTTMAAMAALARRRGVALSEHARRLLELPLLRDACGMPLAFTRVIHPPIRVHRGNKALRAELATWLRGVVWLRGAAYEDALFREASDATELVRQAKVGLERRARLLAQPASEPSVPASRKDRTRGRFARREGVCAGAEGEVVLRDAPAATEEVEARVWLSGRPFATLRLPPSTIPLPLAMALAWNDHLTPRPTFDALEEDDDLRRLVWYGARVGATVAADLVGSLDGAEDEQRASTSALLRAAVAVVAVSHRALGLSGPNPWPLSPREPLAMAPVWPTTDGRWESLASLGSYATRMRALCVASVDAHGPSVDGRPVVRATREERTWLQAALGAHVVIVPYDRGLRPRSVEARQAALAAAVGRDGPCATAFAAEGRRGRVALALDPSGKRSRVMPHHAGVRLLDAWVPACIAPVVVALDVDDLIPSPAWDDCPGFSRETAALEGERALLEATLAGAERVAATAGAQDETVTTHLLNALGARERFGQLFSSEEQRAAVVTRLERVPIVQRLGPAGVSPASLTDIEAAFPPPEAIPVLSGSADVGIDLGGFSPVVVRSRLELHALDRACGGRVADGADQVDVLRRRAAAEEARRRFLAGPRRDVGVPGPHVAEGSPLARHDDADRGTRVGVGLLAPGLPPHPRVEVLFEGRHLCDWAPTDIDWPVAARVDLVRTDHVEDWRALSVAGHSAVLQATLEAGAELVIAVAAAAHGDAGSVLFDSPHALALAARALRLCTAADVGPAPRGELGPLDEAPDSVPSLAMLARERRAPVRARPRVVKKAPVDPATPRLGVSTRARLLRALSDERLLWPTVHGPPVPFPALARNGRRLYVGHERHVGWQGARGKGNELDQPLLFVGATDGGALAALVGAMSMLLADMTDAARALQRRRQHLRSDGAPRLTEPPAHPLLLARLADLGVTEAEGELALCESGPCELALFDLKGPVRTAFAAPFPVRAIARSDELLAPGSASASASASAIASAVAAAAERHLLSLAPSLDELPSFVRTALQERLLAALDGDGSATPELSTAPVFVDVRGAFHSLDELERASARFGFTTAPPPYPTGSESDAVLRLTPAAAARLATRLRLVDMTGYLRDVFEGERRATAPPLEQVALTAEEGRASQWTFGHRVPGLAAEIGVLAPAAAAQAGLRVHVGRRPLCNLPSPEGWPICAAVDATVEPNRCFDGIRDGDALTALETAVAAARDGAIRGRLRAPADALASQHVGLGPRLDDGTPPTTVVGLLWLPAVFPTRPRLRLAAADGVRDITLRSGLPVTLAVEGDLWTPGTTLGPAELVLAGQTAADLVENAARAGVDEGLLAPYRWSLGLGRTDAETPATRAADGSLVTPARVCAELLAQNALWFTRRSGVADGAFPEGGPGFVLLDDGGPLMQVLRAAGCELRELGGAPAEVEEPAAQPPAAEAPAALAGIARRGGEPLAFTEPEHPELDDGLARSLTDALVRLGLAPEPVRAVAYARKGRPLRFDARYGRLVINHTHRTIARLASSAPELLAAAAVSEINRSLVGVTDADERRALESLLRS